MGQKAKEINDEALIAALIGNTTIRGAALACGISVSTVYARLDDPAFMKKYQAVRYDMLYQCTAYIQGILCEAIEKMRTIMNDPEASPQVQLNAASAIAKNCLHLTEQTDVLRQLEELNKAVFR